MEVACSYFGKVARLGYRRASPNRLVNPLRAAVKEWRELNYFGASDTTRELLTYWFERPHRIAGVNSDEIEFRYYFCQREAIETFIYLIELHGGASHSIILFSRISMIRFVMTYWSWPARAAMTS